MSKDQNVVGPGPPPGDIVMFIVENRYRGQHRAAPKTPYLLIVQALNAERSLLMVRVMGISKQAKNGFDKECVPWVETNASLEASLNEYFTINWDQQEEYFHRFSDSRPLSTLVH